MRSALERFMTSDTSRRGGAQGVPAQPARRPLVFDKPSALTDNQLAYRV